jgi:hypothetical protein
MPYGDNCSPRRAELRLPGVDVVVLERRESQGMAGSRGDISPHIHSAGSVAVLVNVETTPVQLHAILFPSGDPAGRGISSYLLVRPTRIARASGLARLVADLPAKVSRNAG